MGAPSVDPMLELADPHCRELVGEYCRLATAPGPVDGVDGPKTRQALHPFQRSLGLEP